MLKKLDIYIMKKYLGTFFFSILLIICVAVVFDLSERLDNFLDNKAPLEGIIFDYYLNFVPYFAVLFTPLFSFISVIFFTSKMAYNTEIIAILAGGVSFRRLLRPYIISAVIIGLMSFALNAFVIPPANKTRLEFSDKYIKKKTSEIARDIQMEVEHGTVLYIERYIDKERKAHNISLEKFDGKTLVSRTTAESAVWDSVRTWSLTDYVRRDFDDIYETLSKGYIMDTVLNINPADFFIIAEHASQMDLVELRKYIERQEDRGVGYIEAFKDEYYKRFSMPFSALILMLIGVSLSSRKVRGGTGLHIAVGIALSAIYILFTTLSSTFGIQGSMPTLLAVWLPNIIFTIIGVGLYIKAPK